MKLSSILSIFVLFTVCNTGLLGNGEEDFYTKYNQPPTARGSQRDFLRFLKNPRCVQCNLQDFDLIPIIQKFGPPRLNRYGERTNKKIDLRGSNCSGANLSNVDLSQAKLSQAVFYGTNFENSNLQDIKAEWSSFRNANMQNADLSKANVEHAMFRGANLSGAKLENVDIERIKAEEEAFYKEHAQPIDAQGLQGHYLKLKTFGGCNDCDLRGFRLGEIINGRRINIGGSDCSNADLSNTEIRPGSHLEFVTFDHTNLENSKLEQVIAQHAKFNSTNLQNTDLRGAYFTCAKFLKANLYGAKVNEETSFAKAEFTDTDLRNVDLEKTDFTGAIFKNCKKGSNFFHKIRTTFAPIFGLFSKK